MTHNLSGITTSDELAGIVDLFGAITPRELADALDELAFKHGENANEKAVATAIEQAISGYILVEVRRVAIGAAGEPSRADTNRTDPTGIADTTPDESSLVDGFDTDSLGDETATDLGSRPDPDANVDSRPTQRAVSTSGRYLIVGPVAFPSFPEGAEDLPHILSIPERQVNRERAAAAVESRLATEAVDAITAGDGSRIKTLLDVCYDLETWADVDIAQFRERLADAAE